VNTGSVAGSVETETGGHEHDGREHGMESNGRLHFESVGATSERDAMRSLREFEQVEQAILKSSSSSQQQANNAAVDSNHIEVSA
jgi:hypothetical protein